MAQEDSQIAISGVEKPTLQTHKMANQIGLSQAFKNYMPFLYVRRLSDRATLPKRMFPYAAGYDLFRYYNISSRVDVASFGLKRI